MPQGKTFFILHNIWNLFYIYSEYKSWSM